ncbi:MAG: RNA 2',3'-cyclic phosphodiesterase [Candidatus Marinimicrobia bacterium]|nr:RNA 2',3'-cyclic phosphodiesterase [Candidatus Neomarinimicrobiota bacterium]
MTPIRTFLALPLPRKLKGYLFTLADQIKDTSDMINWVKRSSIHITLNFLGDTDPALIEEHANGLESLVASFPPLEIGITDTGIFPHANDPRVLWVGAAPYDNKLSQFKSRLNEYLKQLGYPVDYRKFQPHITLGRVKTISRHSSFIHDFLAEQVNEINFEITEMKWYKSTLTSAGAVYGEIKVFKFNTGDQT